MRRGVASAVASIPSGTYVPIVSGGAGIPTYTAGALPAPGIVGRLAWLLNSTRTLVRDNGYAWVAVNAKVNPLDFAPIGDGAYHALSTRYGTLGAAQADYPHVTALTQAIDWAAWQGALNSLTLGGAVEPVTGVFALAGSALVVGSSVAIIGASADFSAAGGYGSTALGTQFLQDSGAIFDLSNAIWSAIHEVTLRGYNVANTTVGIHDDGGASSYLNVSRCRFLGLGGDGVRTNGGVQQIHHNSFRSPKGTGHGIYLVAPGSDSFVAHNDMGGGNEEGSRGILVGGANCTVSENHVFNYEIGIGLPPGATDNRIRGNRCEKNSHHGIQDEGGNNIIEGNHAFNNGSGIGAGASSGIHLKSCTNSTVLGGKCHEQSGVTPSSVQKVGLLVNGATDCDVRGVRCASVTQQGILVTGSTRCGINGNVIRATGGVGITVQAASVDCSLEGNNLYNVSGTGILVQGASLRNRVADNVIRGAGLTQAVKISAAEDADNIIENTDVNGLSFAVAAIVDNGARTVITESSDAYGPDFPYTVDALTTGATSVWPASNRVCWNMVRGRSKSISKIGVHIGVSSGNVAVCVNANSGRGTASAPAARRATSGSVPCPAAGYAEIALGSTLTVVPHNDWFGFAADNTTVTVLRGQNFGQASAIFAGVAYSQVSFPPPDPAAGAAFGWGTHMVGVA